MSTTPLTTDAEPTPAGTDGRRVVVLGGGLAGLATAYHALRAGLDPVVYEASGQPGGNARTLRYGDFLVDTGAHRLHDRDAGATATFRALLGPALQRVEAPSKIYWNGRWVAFPLRPLDAALRLGPVRLARIAAELATRPRPADDTPESFEALALQRYGPTLARAFLLGYSEKLWGVPTDRLDPGVAGGRLRGLRPGTLLRELVGGRGRAAEHLDGAFYYPSHGFGMLADALVEAIGPARLHVGARVTRVEHDGRRIGAVHAAGAPAPVEAGAVVSTIPLPRLVQLMDPSPPAEVLRAAAALRYRHLRLAVVLLDQPSVSSNASLYFPEPHVPFTRLYEPKNRSRAMAPAGQTAAVLEVPCHADDPLWRQPDGAFGAAMVEALRDTGLPIGRVLGTHSLRLAYAYPILETGSRRHVEQLLRWAAGFDGLHLAGRAGTFRYLHTHDLFAEARAWAERLAQTPLTRPAGASV